jgi:hypothetical protein
MIQVENKMSLSNDFDVGKGDDITWSQQSVERERERVGQDIFENTNHGEKWT